MPLRKSYPPLTCAVVAWSLFVCAALFYMGWDAPNEKLARVGLYPESAVWTGAPWVLLTHVFVHIQIWHLAFNLYWFWYLGGELERDLGSKHWALFFVAAAWVSSAAQLASGGIGIGLSGVLYAMFGFGWAARHKLRRAGYLLNDSTIRMLMTWLVVCIFLTWFNLLNVGNGAHIGGLLFGGAVGLFYAKSRYAQVARVGAVLLIALSVVPLFYCPLSPTWKALKSDEAAQHTP